MAYPYIDTPRTEVDGNATYLTNGFRSVGRNNLSALDSVENSFQTPSKDDDVLKVINNGRRRSSGGFKLSTPRAGSGPKSTKSALNERRNLPAAGPAKGEFTPMMQSATKNNFLRNASAARGAGGPKTPAYLRASYRSNANTPGLPPLEMTGIDEEDATDEPTPLPQAASSSAQSTPLPFLPGRNGGVINDGQNVMTLKEQEKTIDKLDKDNFGLKLKIHYLQEQLEKAGPAYNQAALRENTELKVSRMTMQRDISRYRKNLQQAERDLEAYRLQFQELREKYRTKSMDETGQHEMNMMREEIETKDAQVRDLREELREIKENKSQDLEKLRDEIEDLEASLREKDRIIDTRDEEIEELKDRDGKENNSVAELENELQRAKEQMDELQDSLEQARLDSREAKEAEERAVEERERAEKDLNELHEEMANKSISTKGFNRQLEEKANRLEDELQQLRKENEALSEEVESKARREAGLEEQFQKAQQEMDKEERDMQLELDQIRQERDLIKEQHEKISAQLQDALDDVQRHNDEKDLLQTRHNALTDESGGLQEELSHAQSRIRDLQHSLEEERHRATDSGHSVRIQYREEIEKLQDEIEALHHEIEDKEGQFALEQDKWESSKRTLQLQKDRAEDQAAGFKRTIEKLEQVEHTLTGKEDKLQEVIDSEKTRHQNAEAVLSRQVKELNDDLSSKRQFIDDQRSELLAVKDELRIAKREETALGERVQALEDEIVVLQSSLEDEQQYGKGRMQKGSSDQDNQVQKLISEKQRLRDQLANAHVELHDMQTAVSELEAERDELQNNVGQAQDPADNSSRFDREKLELRKGSLRLENEVKRLKDDKSALEQQLNAEIERATAEENQLSAEIDRLQDKLQAGSGGRDRELTSAKSKVQRLERRIRELEDLLEQQQPLVEDDQTVSKADHSMLRHSLDESRKREKALLQRETEQKAFVRNCKSRIADLEKDLHDALMKKFDVKSPQSSPSDKLHQELRSLRKQLGEAHKALKEVKSKNRDLERVAMKDEDQKDIHELLKSSTLEVEALELQLSERDAKLNEMRTQVRRIREERAFCAKKAETANSHVESLQNRYNQTLAKLSSSKNDSDKSRHEKEIHGLGKEIIWLRARLKREEKFRRDLAWSKGLMELGERVRVACNDADLRMIAEMGVKPHDRNKIRTPMQKLRSAFSTVHATVRMQKMVRDWRATKKLGEGLKRAKDEVVRRRDTSVSSKLTL